jgi:photosystem II stability/assembly factor-like uncharacterized protein
MYFNRTYHLIILAILIILSHTFAQDWQWLNPKPFGDNIRQVYFIGEKGWMIPDNFTLYVTNDGGENWETIYSDIYFLHLYFIDENIGWGIGKPYDGNPRIVDDSFSNIYHTTDGGYTWEIQLTDSRASTSIYFLNEKHGWATGNDFYGYVIETLDGGQTWQRIAEHEFDVGDETDAVHFPDSLNGWVLGSQWAIKTDDGGKTWLRDSTLAYYNGIVSINNQILWAYSRYDFRILYTINGGDNWEISELSYSGAAPHVNDMIAINKDSIFAATSDGIFASYNGGLIWKQISNIPLESFYLSDNGNGWGVGYTLDAAMYKLSNFGENWTDMMKYNNAAKDDHFNKIDFVDENVGWIISKNDILKSIDGGISWIVQKHYSEYELTDLQMVDQSSGWVSTSSGTVINTINSGLNWSEYYTGFDYKLTSLSAIDSLTCWTIGYKWVNNNVFGIVLKTTDGGLSWQDQTMEHMSRELHSVSFVDSLHGWIVSSKSAIYHTYDGGRSWEIQKNNDQLSLYRVQFIDRDYGWAIGNDGEFKSDLIFTADGGKSWNGSISSAAFPLTDIKFIDRNNGWIVSYFGEIFSSSNGGINWNREKTYTMQFLKSIDAVDSNHVWTAGKFGAMLCNGKNISNIFQPYDSPINTKGSNIEFSIFPNPFNANTTIRFTLNEPKKIIIEVYDISGRKIENIIIDNLLPGIHTYNWAPSNLSSGIYFMSLLIGENRFVKKCFLIN